MRGRLHHCSVRVVPRFPLPPCRSDRKLQDPPVQVPVYDFALDAAVGPRPVGEEFSNTCQFGGPRGIETDFYALGLETYSFPLAVFHVGLLLKRLVDGAGDGALYKRVGKTRSSDRFRHALDGMDVHLM